MSLFRDQIELKIEEAELETQNTLGEFPRWARWLIIAAVIAIIPAYYISRNISEKIWLGRYQQGQVLAKASFQNPQAPVISPVHVTTLGLSTDNYAAVFQITNPNLNLSLNQVPCTVNFFNAQNQLLYSFTDKLFLLPNQTKYFAVPRFATNDQISQTNVKLPDTLPWQKRLSIPTVQLITSKPNSYQQASPPGFVVEGDYVNNSPYSLGRVRLTFVLFDSANRIVGVSRRDDFTLIPFERRAYKQIWPGVSGSNISNIEVTAETNTLDPNNLSVPDAGGHSSDLNR